MADIGSAALAFDSIADSFDCRFGGWLSVAAQRRAVRRALAEVFPSGSRLIDIGGGTGEDARWLIDHGREVLVTDASPAMIAVAAAKIGARSAAMVSAERLASWADEEPGEHFDGAYSNFAALNCVDDLGLVAHGLARLLRPDAQALLVLFGTCCPMEILVELVRLYPRRAFRRLTRGRAPARLNGHDFAIRYHRAAALRTAMAPWFRLQSTQAIGLFVPTSAAEPWISRQPRLLESLEKLDRRWSKPLARFGDHVLYRFVRTSEAAP